MVEVSWRTQPTPRLKPQPRTTRFEMRTIVIFVAKGGCSIQSRTLKNILGGRLRPPAKAGRKVGDGRMKFETFVEIYCEKGTTEDEHALYWYYFKLGEAIE